MADKDKIQIPEVVMPTGNFEKALDRINEQINETGQTFSNMAERIEKDAAVKIKHSVDSIVKSIDKMASGNNMAKYWKSQDALIEDLTKTYGKLDSAVDVLDRRNLSQELYKTFNALKVISGESFSNLQGLEIIKRVAEWIDKANYRDAFKMEFNPTAFREMFDVFEQMENSGANVQRVFDAINKGTQFDSVSRELRDVKNQLENIASADLTEIQNKLENLSRNASSEFRTFLDFHGIDDKIPQAEEYFDRLERGLITSQDAIKEFKYWYDYLLEENKGTGSSGSEIFNSAEMRQMTEMIAEISFKVSELYSNVNVNSDRQIIEPAGLKELGNIFDELGNHLQEIRKSLGSVDDDLEINTILSSVTKLNNTLTEVANTLERISKSNFSSNFSMTFGGNSEADKQVESYLETTLQQLQERYKRFYEKSAKYGLDDPLMGIYGSVRSLSATYSPTEFENMFSPQAISSITDVTDRIRRLTEFMNILRQAVDANRGSSDFWKDMSKSQIVSSNQLYNMNTVTKNVDKIRNTVAEGNPLEDMFKTDITPLTEQIKEVITNLKEMLSLFRSNEAGNGIVDFANQSVQAINRLTEAFERFSSESKEVLNGLNVNVLGGTIAQETPVSSDITAVEKVKENLKETEIQAEKTEQAVREAINFPSNESTLSNEKSAKDSTTAIKEESKAMDVVSDSARDAANAKEEFANANKKVKDSAEKSIPGLKDEGDVLDNILPSDKKFEEVLKDLDLTKSKLGEIVKITRQAHADEDGNFYESYILRDRTGSTETYGRDSNTEKGQLLRYNYVEKDVKAQERAHKETLKINKAIDETNAIFKEFSSLLGSTDPSSAFNQARAEVERLNNELDSGNITLTEYNKSISKLKNSSGINNVVKWQKQATDALSSFKVKYSQWEGFDGMSNSITNVERAIKSISKDTDLSEILAQIEKMKTELKGIQVPKELTEAKWGNKFYKWLNENTKAVGQFGNRIEELKKQYESIETQGQLDQFGIDFTQFTKDVEKAGKTGLSFFDGLMKRAKSMSQSFIGMYLSLYDIVRYIRTGINTIRELDTALTEMRKVSDESVQSLKNFQKVSFDLADNVGTTAVQIQNSAADWMRLGESMEKAEKSAEVSNILLNVSEFEGIDEATESLVAMSSAYDELDKIDIVDKLNNIGNNFAISTDGIATALQNSASALKTAQNDIDEAIALTTAANAIVQDPDKVGAGLRTIALRITGTEAAREELQNLGEDVDDFVVTTSSKLNQKVMDLTRTTGQMGVSLLDANGNYRSTYEILQDIADIWDELKAEDLQTGQNRQNALLEMLAGKNRSNILASILESPDVLRDVFESSKNSDGSAQEELDKYLESIEARIQKLTNQTQEFWFTFIDSSVVKGGIDALTTLLSLVTDLIDTIGTLPTLLAAIGAGFGIFKVIKGDGIFASKKDLLKQIADNTSQETNNKATADNTAKTDENSVAKTTNAQAVQNQTNQINENTAAIAGNSVATENDTKETLEETAVDTASAKVIDFQTRKVKENTGAKFTNAGADQTNTITSGKSAASETAEAFAFNTNTGSVIKNTAAKVANYAIAHPLATLIGVTLVAAIGGATYAIYRQTHAEEILIKKNDELNSSIKNTTDEISSIQSEFTNTSKSVNNIAKEFAELSQGVDKISGKNISLNAEEYERFKTLGSELLTIFPNLTHVYDENGEAIVTMSGDVDTIVSSLENLVEVQRELANQEILDKAPELFEDVAENSDTYKARIELLQNQIKSLKDFKNELTDADLDFTLNNDVLTFGGETNAELGQKLAIYTKYLHEMGIAFNYLDHEAQGLEGSKKGVWQRIIIEDIDNAKELISNSPEELKTNLQNSINKLNSDIDQIENQNKNNWSSLSSSIITALYDEDAYKVMSDQEQAMIQQIINGIDFSNIDFSSFEDLVDYINVELVDVFSGVNGDNIQEDIANALSLKGKIDSGEIGIDDYITEIDTLIEKLTELGVSEDIIKSITVLINYEDAKEIQNAGNDIIETNARKSGRDRDKASRIYKNAYNQLDITSQDDNAIFAEALDYATTAGVSLEEQLELIIQKYKELKTVSESASGGMNVSTITSSVQQIATQLEPQFSKLGELYKSIFYADGGFDANVIDNAALEEMRTTFTEGLSELGVDFNTDEVEQFFKILGDGEATTQEAQDAFNKLATSWFYATDTIENLNAATAKTVEQELEKMGVINAEEIVEHNLALNEAKDNLASLQAELDEAYEGLAGSSVAQREAAKGMIEATYQKIEAYYNEIGATEELRLALFSAQLAAQGFNTTDLNSAESCQQLLQLAETAGLSGKYIEQLVYLEELWNAYHTATGENMKMEIHKKIQSVQFLLESGLKAPKLELDIKPPSTEDAGGAGKDAGDAYLEAFEKELEELQDLRDRGKITEKEYLDQLRLLYTKYFKDRKEYLKEFEKYEHEYLDGMKSLYESAADAAISLLDKQIDKYNDQKDAAVKALEEQKEAAEEAYQAEIDSIQEQIDLIDKQISKKQEQIDKIQDAQKQRQAELDAAKALYELEKAQGQRSIQTLKDGQRVYINDPSSIRDAQNNVDDTKDELRISKIEKEISVLEKRKTSMEEQQDAIQKMIDASNKHYDELIKNTESYWDSLIQGLENYKSRWEELKEIEERAEIENTLKQLGMSTESILSMSDEAFQQYKNDYLNILADMYRGNDQMYDSLSKVTGVDFSTLNGYLADTAELFGGLNELKVDQFKGSVDEISNSLGTVKDAVTDTANSISGTPGTSENSDESGQGEGASVAVDSLSGSMKQFETDTNTVVQNVSVKLGQLQRSIENVREDIGTEKSAEDSEDLIGSIHTLEKVASDKVYKTTELFGDLKDQIEPSATALNEIQSTLEELDGKEFTVSLIVDGADGLRKAGSSHSSLADAQGTAHYEGTAKVQGDWATHEGGKTLVGELGQEIIVRNGRFFTVGDNGAEFVNLQPGDIVFNHLQTRELLKNGHISSHGQALASGTVQSLPRNLVPLETANPEKYKMLTAIKDIMLVSMKGLQDAFNTQTKQIESTVKQAVKVALQNNTVPTNVNMDVNITLPNVTNDSGVHYIEKELGNLSLKGLQYFKQK